MIDHDRRVIFIHQRKVAGMSIMAVFGRSIGHPDFDPFNDGVLSAEWAGRNERERSYTDCGEPENKAANVEYVHIGFEDYKALVRDHLGIHFNPAGPYKLCDVRPCYADIHAREIAG